MTLALLACMLVTFAALFYVFYLPGELHLGPEKTRLAYLRERKDAIYENLRDLQFEYRVGKLSDEDYQKTKQGLQKELAAVLAEIDAIVKPGTAAVAAKAPSPSPAPMPAPKPKPDGRLCPHCGAHFERMLKFCGECGKAMAS